MTNELKLAYFAGLIDGEGNVAIYKYASGAVRPVIKVKMTCLPTIKALYEFFGGYMGDVKNLKPGKHKEAYIWEVTYTQAKVVAGLLRPYSITKVSAYDEIITFVPRPKGKPARL